MLSKTTIAAAVAAVALALASAISAVPINGAAGHAQQRRQEPQCKSLGQGPLGFNSSAIQLYSSKPPATWLAAQDREIVASSAAPYNGTFFEFIQCRYDAPEYEGKGSIDTYQGYIKAPDGSCLTVDDLTAQNVTVKTEACDFSGSQYYGGVAPKQHFQFQLDTFYFFYSVVFLGRVPGPADDQQFGEGGSYHFGLGSGGNLEVSYLPDQPQTGKSSEQVIAQIGSQYVSQKTMPYCELVKQGPVELVNKQTGEAQQVNPQSGSKDNFGLLVVNGTEDSVFNFYQCDSTYMGFQSDATNWYGHFVATAVGEAGCVTKEYINYIGRAGGAATVNQGDSIDSPDAPCGQNDGSIQLSSFFHLANVDDVYEINFLGYTTAQQEPEYGWSVEVDSYISQPFLIYNVTSTEYTLRFTDSDSF